MLISKLTLNGPQNNISKTKIGDFEGKMLRNDSICLNTGLENLPLNSSISVTSELNALLANSVASTTQKEDWSW